MAGFPNVPFAPGVPPLLRAAGAVAGFVTMLQADAFGIINLFSDAQWGLYQGGLPVVVADNVVSFDYKQEYDISDYPVEEGAFESYDKVQRPFHVRLRFSSGGSQSDRQALLDSVAAVIPTLELYDAVTPEAVYTSVNVTHYNYSRTASRGAGLITVDVACEQVRVTTVAEFTNTQAPSGANTQNGGTMQTVTVTPASLRDNQQLRGAIT